VKIIGRRDFLRRLGNSAAVAFSGSIIGILWQGNANADEPKIQIKHEVSSKGRTFDPQNPPAEKPANEDAFTLCEITCKFSFQHQYRMRRSEGFCAVEVTIKSVTIDMNLAIKIWMPNEPSAQAPAEEKLAWRVLLRHENGHSLICRRLFDAIAEKLAHEQFRVPPGFSFILPPNDCKDETAKKESAERVSDLLRGFCDKTSEAVEAELKKAADTYDLATAHGTAGSGPGGGSEPATKENQTRAAEKVVADAVAAFNTAHH